MSAPRNKKTLFIAALAALLLGAGAWAYASRAKPEVQDPAKLMDKMREIRERKDLTDDQKHKLFEENRPAMELAFNKRIDDWYSAPTKEAKNAILDKNIDEREKRRKEMEARRDSSSQPSSRPSNRRGWGNSSPDERKSRSESHSPDRMARMSSFMKAMHQRMEERGIKPPQGGWGQWGGNRGGGAPRH